MLFSLYRNLGQAETEILQWWRCSWLTNRWCRRGSRIGYGCLNWSNTGNSSRCISKSKLHVNSNRCMCIFALIIGALFLLQGSIANGIVLGSSIAYGLMKADSMTEEKAKDKVSWPSTNLHGLNGEFRVDDCVFVCCLLYNTPTICTLCFTIGVMVWKRNQGICFSHLY